MFKKTQLRRSRVLIVFSIIFAVLLSSCSAAVEVKPVPLPQQTGELTSEKLPSVAGDTASSGKKLQKDLPNQLPSTINDVQKKPARNDLGNTKLQDSVTDVQIDDLQKVVVYQKYKDLRKPDLGFANLGFHSYQNAGKYTKTYRVNQLLKHQEWTYDEASGQYRWSVNKKLYDDVFSTDSTVKNPKILLYLSVHQKILKNNQFSRSDNGTWLWNSLKQKKYHNILKDEDDFGLGVKIDYSNLIQQKNLSINFGSNYENIQLQVSYDSGSNQINFRLNNIDATKNKLFHLYRDFFLPQNKLIFNYHDSFSAVEYQTDNNDNKTLINFDVPTKYQNLATSSNPKALLPNFEQKLGVVNNGSFFNPKKEVIDLSVSSVYDTKNYLLNAFDLKTRKMVTYDDFVNGSRKDWQNDYLELGTKVYQFNTDDHVDQIRARTIASQGTWTMLAKVNPSNPLSTLYYMITNNHVIDSRTAAVKYNQFDDQKPLGNNFLSLGSSLSTWINKNDENFVWRANATLDRAGHDIRWERFRNGKSYKKDVAIVVIDTNDLVNQRNLSGEERKRRRDFFARWQTLPPLKFRSGYDNVINSNYSSDLVNWTMNGYPAGFNLTYRFNKIHSTDQLNENIYLTSNQGNTDYFFTKGGSSGTSVIDQDNNLIGLLYSSDNGKSTIVNLKSWNIDLIGDNSDGSDPSKNVNPGTFCHWVINNHKKYPSVFSILDMCKTH